MAQGATTQERDAGWIMTSITSDDEKLLERYRQFQEEHRSFLISKSADYHNFLDDDWYNAVSMPVVLLAQGHPLAASNAANQFWNYLHRLIAWNKACLSG